jgi:cytochrome c
MSKNPVVVSLGAVLVLAGGAASAADPDAGKAIFQKTCAVCHSTEVGVNKVGPSLWSVYGRRVAAVPDYNYSEKLRSAQREWNTWDAQKLDAYLSNPRQVLHGVKMFFALPDAKDRADVIAYLKSLK